MILWLLISADYGIATNAMRAEAVMVYAKKADCIDQARIANAAINRGSFVSSGKMMGTACVPLRFSK